MERLIRLPERWDGDEGMTVEVPTLAEAEPVLPSVALPTRIPFDRVTHGTVLSNTREDPEPVVVPGSVDLPESNPGAVRQPALPDAVNIISHPSQPPRYSHPTTLQRRHHR